MRICCRYFMRNLQNWQNMISWWFLHSSVTKSVGAVHMTFSELTYWKFGAVTHFKYATWKITYFAHFDIYYKFQLQRDARRRYRLRVIQFPRSDDRYIPLLQINKCSKSSNAMHPLLLLSYEKLQPFKILSQCNTIFTPSFFHTKTAFPHYWKKNKNTTYIQIWNSTH